MPWQEGEGQGEVGEEDEIGAKVNLSAHSLFFFFCFLSDSKIGGHLGIKVL